MLTKKDLAAFRLLLEEIFLKNKVNNANTPLQWSCVSKYPENVYDSDMFFVRNARADICSADFNSALGKFVDKDGKVLNGVQAWVQVSPASVPWRDFIPTETPVSNSGFFFALTSRGRIITCVFDRSYHLFAHNHTRKPINGVISYIPA